MSRVFLRMIIVFTAAVLQAVLKPVDGNVIDYRRTFEVKN
jgi:hypothetical protein